MNPPDGACQTSAGRSIGGTLHLVNGRRVSVAAEIFSIAPCYRRHLVFAVGFNRSRTYGPTGAPAFGYGGDLANGASLTAREHGVPVGLAALDELPWLGELALHPARGGERFVTASGLIDTVAAGEIIYTCGDAVLARRWTMYGSTGCPSSATRLVVASVDVLDPACIDERAVLDTVGALFAGCGYSVTDAVTLDRDQPVATVV